MADKVLYFPYIRVPQNEWFTRMLLYWDEVGSIVPMEYADYPERLGGHMAQLVEAKLVRPVIPGQHIWEIPRFTEAFLEFVDTNPTIGARRPISLGRHGTSHIHMEKLGPIGEELCNRELARESGYPWYEVEEFTAFQFMAYLAAVLGPLEELGFVPATDEAQYLAAFSSEQNDRSASMVLRDRLRAAILEDVLPAPAGGVSVSELGRFKSRYADLLRGFRNRIEWFVVDIAGTVDPDARTEKLRLARDQLGDEIEELGARMRESRWPRVFFGTVCGLLASALPGAAALATGNIVAAGIAVPGLVKAIHSAFSGTRSQAEIMRSPLAYAALAQRGLA